MSREIPRNDKLPKHQHKIMFCLARDGAMNISDTNKKIHNEPNISSTTRVFHVLKQKNLITEIGAKSYRGRQFPKYWLTGKGLAYIFLNFNMIYDDSLYKKLLANPDLKDEILPYETIEKYAAKYLKDKNVETYLKMRSALLPSDDTENLLDYSMLHGSNLTFEIMTSNLILSTAISGKLEALKTLDLTKLPKEYRIELKQNLENARKSIDFILENIQEN